MFNVLTLRCTWAMFSAGTCFHTRPEERLTTFRDAKYGRGSANALSVTEIDSTQELCFRQRRIARAYRVCVFRIRFRQLNKDGKSIFKCNFNRANLFIHLLLVYWNSFIWDISVNITDDFKSRSYLWWKTYSNRQFTNVSIRLSLRSTVIALILNACGASLYSH